MSKLAQVLKSHTDVNGVTLYDHLNTFLSEILKTNHQDLNTVELLSDFTKKNRFLFRALPSDKEVNSLRDSVPEFKEWANRVGALLQRETVAQIPTIIQDFVQQAKLLEVAGLGFSEDEAYQIQLSLRKLALDTQASELAFFGKILCRNNDYYVARGVVPKLPTDHMPPNVEIRGDGVNFYTFWVTHDDWIELPLSTPEQIRGVREIRYIFTGNLEAEIKGYPNFPGKEKHFLKAQLVRICHANLIAPKGFYRAAENPKDIEFEEDIKMPEFGELANPETWVHVPAMILKAGRITHYPDPSLSEEQKAEIAEKDPEGERLKGIAEDRPLEPFYQSNWLVKKFGDEQQFGAKDDGGNNNTYAVVYLKNYTWPGAVTIANQNGWGCYYFGYGFKETQAQFSPIKNEDLQAEPDDQTEFPEPNPKNPPKPPVQDPVDGANPDQDNADQDPDAQ